jgi:hypothetical protein
MALSCQVSLNVGSYAAGQNPAPMATVFVSNPGAVAVVVTSIQMQARVLNADAKNRLAMPPSVPPTGPGMTTTVPAGSSINIGPFPIVVASAANVNSFQAVNQAGNLNPINAQGSQPAQYTMMVGAQVYGSDGSVNEAGEAALLVSYQSAPPVGFQGGFLDFGGPNNFIGWTPGWP